jgi:hypothetical protein
MSFLCHGELNSSASINNSVVDQLDVEVTSDDSIGIICVSFDGSTNLEFDLVFLSIVKVLSEKFNIRLVKMTLKVSSCLIEGHFTKDS